MNMAYISTGLTRGKVLIFEGFRYQKNKTKQDVIHWRCWRKMCSIFLTTDIFDIEDEGAAVHVLTVGLTIQYCLHILYTRYFY